MCSNDTTALLVKMERYCAYQDRSLAEVRNKLVQSKASTEQVSLIVDRLIATDFLNERRFAESYVSGKSRIKKWGKSKIRLGLIAKGVSENLCNDVLSELDVSIEYQNLLDLASKKTLLMNETDAFKKKIRLYRFLAQKGYSADMISKCLGDLAN